MHSPSLSDQFSTLQKSFLCFTPFNHSKLWNSSEVAQCMSHLLNCYIQISIVLGHLWQTNDFASSWLTVQRNPLNRIHQLLWRKQLPVLCITLWAIAAQQETNRGCFLSPLLSDLYLGWACSIWYCSWKGGSLPSTLQYSVKPYFQDLVSFGAN